LAEQDYGSEKVRISENFVSANEIFLSEILFYKFSKVISEVFRQITMCMKL